MSTSANPIFPLKSSHKPVKAYYEALAQFQKHGHTTEGNTRSAFADLLKKCCSPYGWHLVEEYHFKGTSKQPLRADGALIDELTLQHGIWEAKDTADDLQKEIKAKVAKGYPLTNILFQSPTRAVLYQDSRIALDCDLTNPENLVEVLQLFFDHQQTDIPDWKDAVDKFSAKIKELAGAIKKLLAEEYDRNRIFRENYESFAELCRQSINPDLQDDAIRNMLVQHLLTERIFRKVFNNEEFLKRNVIAAEIEKVISSITLKHFSRDTFLKSLDHFYKSIERAAEAQTEYTEKQHFLNAVYEKFFQNFDEKQADTMGIVYTPQPIVDFMVRSVDEILQQEFGKSLSDSGVHILDPFTGTGNFITRIMQQIKRSALPHKYAEELHCNEIMLLPYYIASMNIEHAYVEKAKEYKPFEGICLVDTFDTTGQTSLFSTENTKRIRRQIDAEIRVVIGNPPYNMGQTDEGEENKNRKYAADGSIDKRVSKTYAADSHATLKNKLGDPYVKAFRWATDRITDHGVVCFVSNNSFIDQIAFDGMRRHLARDFDSIYVMDLGGNVRKNPKLSGTTHNVFGIQVGVAITILVRKPGNDTHVPATIRYARMPEFWKRGQKANQLADWKAINNVDWGVIEPDTRFTWLTEGQQDDFAGLLPLCDKAAKGDEHTAAIFGLFSLGIVSSRDAYVYNFDAKTLTNSMESSVDAYIETLPKYKKLRQLAEDSRSHIPSTDLVIKKEDKRIKWSHLTKVQLGRLDETQFHPEHIVKALYRPYCANNFYFDGFWNERRYQNHRIFPPRSGEANPIIYVSQNPGPGGFCTLATIRISDFHLIGDSQGMPFYRYDQDGTNRGENITDWALTEFRTHYADNSITKWDVFHCTYAVLHHPEYRTRYAANLKRELPRIPFPPDLHTFAAAGKRLMELHIDYEKQPEYKLEQIEDPKADVTFRVERMKLNPKDKSELRCNDFLTLRGIPLAAFDYRLGNRSALEWVIDQYRVSTDPRSGIVNDPNREDDPQYILRLIGQVITVSLETQQIIASLPSLNLGA